MFKTCLSDTISLLQNLERSRSLAPFAHLCGHLPLQSHTAVSLQESSAFGVCLKFALPAEELYGITDETAAITEKANVNN